MQQNRTEKKKRKAEATRQNEVDEEKSKHMNAGFLYDSGYHANVWVGGERVSEGEVMNGEKEQLRLQANEDHPTECPARPAKNNDARSVELNPIKNT